MKIDMVTLQEGRNYGSVLQAFASVKFFELHGCTLNILNTVRENRKASKYYEKIFTRENYHIACPCHN